MGIENNVREILSSIPTHVILEAAAKTRSKEEVLEAISAGINIIGENYLQEAEEMIGCLGNVARWHYIGGLQSRKIKKIVSLFDMIETLGTIKHAELIDRYAGELGKVMPVLIEINSGREEQKGGVSPDDAIEFVKQASSFENMRISGLMTMGRYSSDKDAMRACFSSTRGLFDRLAAQELPNVEMRYLSMGMSASYRLAVEEGANMIRVGEGIFGPRAYY